MRPLIPLALALSLVAQTVAAAQQASEGAPEPAPIPARASIHIGALGQARQFAYGGGNGNPPIRFAASGTVLGIRLGGSLGTGIALELAGNIARDAAIGSKRRERGFHLIGESRVTISELTLAARFAPARACIRRVCGNFSVGVGAKRYDFAESMVAFDDYIDTIEPDQATATFLFGVGVRFPLRGSTFMIDLVDTTNPLRHQWMQSAGNPHDVSLLLGVEHKFRRRPSRSR